MSSIDYLNLCRLCLVKESAFVPIFDGEGDSRQIFHKIAACLPVKVTRDDKLPKKICNECVQKIELFYQFCNTTTNAEKQLLEWIGGVDLNDKQTYVSAVINQDQSSNNRLDGNVMQQTNEQHQNNIDMNMMESIGLEMPMMIQQNQTQMTINYTNNTNAQSMQSNTIAQQQNNSKNMEESDDDHCGGDDDMGQNEELSVKEEIQDSNRTIEPTFVSVSSPCEEAGPSGLQQKSGDIPDGQFLAGQSTDGDPKSGCIVYIKEEFHLDNLQMLDQPMMVETNEKDRLFNKAMSVKVNDLYDCSHCELVFPTKLIAKEHELVRHSKKIDKCRLCNLKRNCSHKTVKHSVHADDDYDDDDDTDDTEVDKNDRQRPWQQGGRNRAQLAHGFFVFIDTKELEYIEKRKIKEPSQLVSVVMRKILGKTRLKNMSLTGRGGKEVIPKDVINAVKKYVTNKIPNKVLAKANLRRCITILCRNMRRAK